ncbi:hypothetical protein D8682_08585 [Buttiauxella sp. 3AFRM03]|uniref:hypothetical protein n=1 Tax=Buttiauxella sp. 3AFRM03 TaxID=2479367 RepID=UPI000EF8039F|nr:hypothetical protein [Buttiauxella sp. 3AFRM03]AYN27037.1 hypothetical protein D8682_08585 [Buttiauxella sp. 3AFRM03]
MSLISGTVGWAQDYKQVYAWLSVSAANAQTKAASWRDATAEKLTPERLSDAQKVATRYIEQ